MSEPEKYSIPWGARRFKELEAENARMRAALDHDAMMHRDEIERLRAEVERLQTGWDLATKAVDENNSLRAEIERLQKECEEQARLNGMGAERELALRAENARLRCEIRAK